jgi:hypothetical protein
LRRATPETPTKSALPGRAFPETKSSGYLAKLLCRHKRGINHAKLRFGRPGFGIEHVSIIQLGINKTI